MIDFIDDLEITEVEMATTTLTSSSFFGGLDETRSDIDKVVQYYDHHAKNYNACLHNSRYTETTDYCADLLKKNFGMVY